MGLARALKHHAVHVAHRIVDQRRHGVLSNERPPRLEAVFPFSLFKIQDLDGRQRILIPRRHGKGIHEFLESISGPGVFGAFKFCPLKVKSNLHQHLLRHPL